MAISTPLDIQIAEKFKEFDINRSGYLELNELADRSGMQFNLEGFVEADTDKDGKISLDECMATVHTFMRLDMIEKLKDVDVNGNGYLEPNEFWEMKNSLKV